MNYRGYLLTLTLILLTFTQCKHTAIAEQPPNVILILVDDMGFSDLGAYGSEIETPNIDRLAFEGLRFTNAYNTSKCFHQEHASNWFIFSPKWLSSDLQT